MSEEAIHPHHSVDYVELTVTDMASARDFYARAFDWELNDFGPGYSGIQGVDKEDGGLRLDGEVTAPLVVLYSENLEASLQAVEDAGGKIVRPPYEFPGGRRFHFTDPAGNELAVWSA